MALEYGGLYRSLSRNKRIVGTSNGEDDDDASTSLSKRMRSYDDKYYRLDTLPHELLVKVLCGVDHDDLEQLYQVSKRIKDAALHAKSVHFQYTTPRMRTLPEDEDSEMEGPNAPLQRKSRSRTRGRNLADITVVLFPEESD